MRRLCFELVLMPASTVKSSALRQDGKNPIGHIAYAGFSSGLVSAALCGADKSRYFFVPLSNSRRSLLEAGVAFT